MLKILDDRYFFGRTKNRDCCKGHSPPHMTPPCKGAIIVQSHMDCTISSTLMIMFAVWLSICDVITDGQSNDKMN